MSLPPVYVINLARSTDRWATISAALAARGIGATRIDAVDGADAAATRRQITWQQTTVPEAACIASHLRALVAAEAAGHTQVLVMEDDTTFELFDAWPGGWEDIAAELPPGFGLCSLTLGGSPRALDRIFRGPGRVAAIDGRDLWSTGAYVIERAALTSLLDRYGRGPFDVRGFSRGRHDACKILLWSLERAYFSRAPLFLYAAGDSLIHPHHLDEHRVARAFVLEHHAAVVAGRYEPRYGLRARLSRSFHRLTSATRRA